MQELRKRCENYDAKMTDCKAKKNMAHLKDLTKNMSRFSHNKSQSWLPTVEMAQMNPYGYGPKRRQNDKLASLRDAVDITISRCE